MYPNGLYGRLLRDCRRARAPELDFISLVVLGREIDAVIR
jgi:hypothetical protein